MEIWVKAFGDIRYEVSNMGRVKSYNKERKKKDFIFCYLNPIKNFKGYNMVNLGGKQHKLSRLIMKSFFGDSNLQVNHINGIKNDDRLKNLEWNTPSENINHAYKNGLMNSGEAHYRSKLTKEDVIKIYKDPRYQRTIAKDFNISQTNVNRIKRKIIWKHIWGP